MPRPSLKNQRRTLILDAYGKCIARFGVEGATLEKTAEEAGLARALIRHNVGNKDDLLDAFLEQFLTQSAKNTATLFDALPEKNRVQTLVDWLFEGTFADSGRINITNALLIAASDNPQLAKKLKGWTQDFIDRIRGELTQAYPKTEGDKLDAVAVGIAAIFLNFDTLSPIGSLDNLQQSSKTATKMLIASLEG
ncbi:MAG: TetR/AcrR family transcriptional regulator [Pseudomonadota bacterium]